MKLIAGNGSSPGLTPEQKAARKRSMRFGAWMWGCLEGVRESWLPSLPLPQRPPMEPIEEVITLPHHPHACPFFDYTSEAGMRFVETPGSKFCALARPQTMCIMYVRNKKPDWDACNQIYEKDNKDAVQDLGCNSGKHVRDLVKLMRDGLVRPKNFSHTMKITIGEWFRHVMGRPYGQR